METDCCFRIGALRATTIKDDITLDEMNCPYTAAVCLQREKLVVRRTLYLDHEF